MTMPDPHEEPEAIEPAYAWNIRGLEHAYSERKPTEYIVDKFLSAGSLNMIYGAPATMKSMIMADLCAAVVAGTDWLPGCFDGRGGVGVKQSPVFWLDMDNGTRRTDERIDAVAKAHRLTEDAPFHYVSMPMPPFNIGEIDALIYLKTLIRSLGARLVVIDNLGLITGEIEENSAGMAMVMGYLRQIAEGTNSALVVIHHQRKGGANGSRAGDALRGHSSIEAAIDLALHVVREPEANEISIRSTKTRGVDVPAVRARFNYDHVPGTNDLALAWFDGVPPKRGENALRDAILETVENFGRIGKTKLINQVKEELGMSSPGINKIRAWIDDMIAVTKELEEVKEGTYRVIKLA